MNKLRIERRRSEKRRPMPAAQDAAKSRIMAELWLVYAKDSKTAAAMERCPSAVVIRGNGMPVYAGNSVTSPYGAQPIRAGDLLPMYIR